MVEATLGEYQRVSDIKQRQFAGSGAPATGFCFAAGDSGGPPRERRGLRRANFAVPTFPSRRPPERRARAPRRGVGIFVRIQVVCMLLLVAAAVPAQQVQAPDSEPIRVLIARGTLPQLRHPDFADFRIPLDDFYRDGGYAPQWLAGNASWRAALSELAAASTHGLDAADYDIDWLDGEIRAITAGDRTAERVARADVALTVSFFRLLSDLHRGRVSPARAGFKFNPGDKPLDYTTLLRGGMSTGRMHDVIASVEPSFPAYRRLKEVLARYRELAATPLTPLPPLPAGMRKIEPGGSYAGVDALRARLRLVGDLPASAEVAAGNRYEGALVEAVRAFQNRYGL